MKRLMTLILVLTFLGCAGPVASRGIGGANSDERGVVRKQGNSPAYSNRLALVIGNAAYSNSPLRNPVNDARAVAQTLRGLGFIVIQEENLSRTGIFQAVRKFGEQLGSGSVGLFYFSGHGIQMKGKNYLLPVDADIRHEDEVPAEAYDSGLVLGKMEAANNPLNLLILDACRNNPFAKSWAASSGLAKISAPGGTKLIFAARPGTLALDGEGNNSPFTKNLIAGMQQPGKDVEDVIRYVANQLERETNGAQEPWAEGILKEKFYFVAGSGGLENGGGDGDGQNGNHGIGSNPCRNASGFCDDFSDPAFDGRYSEIQWYGEGEPSGFVQNNGVMTVSQNPSGKADTRLCPQAYRNVNLQGPVVLETRMKLTDRNNHGDALLMINLHKDYNTAQRKMWSTMCRLTPDGNAYCHFAENARGWNERWSSERYPAAIGSWHTFRVEFDPATVTFRYFLDGDPIGSVTSKEASAYQNSLLFRPSVGVANWGYSRFGPQSVSIDYLKIEASNTSDEGDSKLSVLDDFEDSAFDGKFDPSKWHATGFPESFRQENGVIRIVQEGRTNSYTALMPIRYHGIERKGPFHLEMKCKFDEKVHAGSLLIVVDIHNGYQANPRKRWSGTIRLSPYGHAYAKVGRNHPKESFKELYRSGEVPINYGEWYTLGIYADPSTMRFRFFFDGQNLGEYVVDEAKGVLPDIPTYQALIGVANWGSNRKDRIIGYVDEVRVKEGR